MAVGTGLEAGHGLGLQKRGDWGWNTAGLGGKAGALAEVRTQTVHRADFTTVQGGTPKLRQG